MDFIVVPIMLCNEWLSIHVQRDEEVEFEVDEGEPQAKGPSLWRSTNRQSLIKSSLSRGYSELLFFSTSLHSQNVFQGSCIGMCGWFY